MGPSEELESPGTRRAGFVLIQPAVFDRTLGNQ